MKKLFSSDKIVVIMLLFIVLSADISLFKTWITLVISAIIQAVAIVLFEIKYFKDIVDETYKQSIIYKALFFIVFAIVSAYCDIGTCFFIEEGDINFIYILGIIILALPCVFVYYNGTKQSLIKSQKSNSQKD